MRFGFPRLLADREAYSLSYLLLVAGVITVFLGFFRFHLWQDFPTKHTATLIVVCAAAWLLAGLLTRFLRWPALNSGANALVLIFGLGLVWMAGSRPVLAVLLMVAAAAGVGARLTPRDMPVRWAVAVIAGLAVMAGGLGWVLSVRGHGPWVYCFALVFLVIVSRNELKRMGEGLVSGWTDAVAASPWMATLAVMSLGLVSLVLWLPDLAYDDLAYHLALPVQLSELGYYRLDPATQVWALAPWAGDVIQAIARVLSGEAARGAVNGMWLILSGGLLWRVGREIGLDSGRAWLTVALYVSMPMTAMLAMGQQTEGPSIAVLLALALVILRAPPRPDGATLQLAAVLVGCLLALKLSNVLSAAPMCVWLLMRWRGSLPWRAVPAALVLLLLISGSSYFHAWALTGNPVLPLYNDIFQSQFMKLDRFQDFRWNAPLGWALPLRLTFKSGAYLESWAGAAGFLMVGLLGLLPLALIRSKQGTSVRPLILVGLCAFLLPLMFVHYLRYAQPGLVLMLPALIASLEDARPRVWAERCLIGLVVLNFAYQGNVSWVLHFGAVPKQIREGREAVLERFAAEVRVAEWLHTQPPGEARILMIDRNRSYIAPFAGQAFARNWYDLEIHTLADVADEDLSGKAWQQAWFDLGMTHVLTVEPMTPSVQAAIEQSGARLVYSFGDTRVWQLPHPGPRDLLEERNLARQRVLGRWIFE